MCIYLQLFSVKIPSCILINCHKNCLVLCYFGVDNTSFITCLSLFFFPGVTYPSGAVQKQLLDEVYGEANVNPSDVAYVEAHGTGTKAGDPEELNAITSVFCKNRPAPLLIGSVKSNMGHPEPASGLCGVTKVLLAMQHGVIPPNLHFNSPNPDIPALLDGRLKVSGPSVS